jgi:hypothetical protein
MLWTLKYWIKKLISITFRSSPIKKHHLRVVFYFMNLSSLSQVLLTNLKSLSNLSRSCAGIWWLIKVRGMQNIWCALASQCTPDVLLMCLKTLFAFLSFFSRSRQWSASRSLSTPAVSCGYGLYLKRNWLTHGKELNYDLEWSVCLRCAFSERSYVHSGHLNRTLLTHFERSPNLSRSYGGI